MATPIGPTVVPIPIPDPNLLHPEIGQRQSSPTFFLRATPPIFTVLNVGGSNTNQDFVFRAFVPPGPEPTLPRFVAGARGSGLTIDFEVLVAGTGSVAPSLSGSLLLGSSIAGAGSVSANLVKPLSSLAVGIAGSGVVAPSLSGGSTTGGLVLDPEVSTGLVLTPEAGTSEDLTPEVSDSLTLVPED